MALSQIQSLLLVLVVGLIIGTESGALAQPCSAPYGIPKFQAAIAECKLQAPTSSTAATQAELMDGYCSDWFRVADTDKMAFYQAGASQRTELRYLDNWYVTNANRTAHANLKIVSQTCDQVTFMQIHDDANAGAGPNKPLLRIYKYRTKSPANHLWAAIKTDSGGENTAHVDLGPAPTGYFDCDITVAEGNLHIAIEGTNRVNMRVAFWTYPSYWKAGVYLQDAGDVTIHFNELTWIETPTQHTLTTNVVGQGTVSLDPAGGNYDAGTVVTATAIPDSGRQFDGWSGDLAGAQNPDTITMDADKTVTATFSLVSPPTLNITLSGDNVVLSWPTNGTAGFALESASNCTHPIVWTAEGAPTVVGNENRFTNSLTGNTRYYRLNKP
jgi:uncharacterized repeat protein (TIGR02543 family)